MIVLFTKLPATTDTFPEFVSEKSNGFDLVKVTLAMALGFALDLKARALIDTLLEMAKGAVYRVDDWLGVVPSVVK